MKESTGSRLRQVMKENNMRQVDVLERVKSIFNQTNVKVSKTDLSQYVNDKVEPRQDKLHVLARVLQVNEAWLMGYDVPKERSDSMIMTVDEKQTIIDNTIDILNDLNFKRQNNVYDYAKKQLDQQQNKVFYINKKRLNSIPVLGKTAANPTELSYGDITYDETADTNIPRCAESALVIQGDSMEPLLKNGSIVFYKQQQEVENGEIAIVDIDGNGVTCKKVYFNYDLNIVVLKSLNDKYQDREISPDRIKIIGKVVL